MGARRDCSTVCWSRWDVDADGTECGGVNGSVGGCGDDGLSRIRRMLIGLIVVGESEGRQSREDMMVRNIYRRCGRWWGRM